MYAGRVVERGTLTDIFDEPLHPYTQGLMAAIPTLPLKKGAFHHSWTVPSASDFPKGCRFAPRCDRAKPECMHDVPPIKQVSAKHYVQCWLEV